ncbi:carboxymuconolactone decarboxylase family protein [Actinotalea sp. BY-33]|uniref:Carboxymuconolactone decarboxylase family protein n=1 Tax=Actinotalea soli TaxID=2819234 RepID=A0A939RUC9_9CELL|nr:carboxymuconolactone decarboxylase family protein [Actinotalea soli]MBO1752499.1 carboxymuconolactone decarboxylase family protein [Actinotalea soli]
MAHVNIGKVHPKVYKAMTDLGEDAASTAGEEGLDPRLVELVKIRASQINGCAYCLRSHTRDAAALGETPERLAVLAAWWESQYFTPQERAALLIVEKVTLISDRAPAPAREAADVDVLTERQISAITWVAIAMNALNRIAVSSHFPVGA